VVGLFVGEVMSKKYEIVETTSVIKRDRTAYAYQFSVDHLEASELVEGYDFKPHENKRVKVIIMIEAED
jgi:hypothetical protein